MRPPTRDDVLKALADVASKNPAFAALIPEPHLTCPICDHQQKISLLQRVVIYSAPSDGPERIVSRGVQCSTPTCMQPIWDEFDDGEEPDR